MQIVNIHQAKTQLSKLLEQIQSGEDVVIAKAGLPIARLVLYSEPKRVIAAPGAMREKIVLSDDFNLPLDPLFDTLNDRLA